MDQDGWMSSLVFGLLQDDATTAALFWRQRPLTVSMPTTLLSPPPPQHDPSNALPAGPVGTSPRANGDGGFSGGGAGRRSALPSLIPGRSSLPISSSPRHHALAAATASQPLLHTSSPPLLPQQQQTLSPSFWQDQTFDSDFDFPNSWDDDTLNQDPLINLTHNPDEQYLTPLAEGDLASTTFASFPPNIPSLLQPSAQPVHLSAAGSSSSLAAAAPRPSDARNEPLAGPSRSDTQLTATTLDDSLNTQFTDDLFGDEALPDSSQTSFTESMPATRKRTASTRDPPLATKRQRISGEDLLPAHNSTVIESLGSDDLFGDSTGTPTPIDDPNPDDFTIDLTEANEVPEELKKPDEDKRIKIAAFQCVICMDDVTSLTLTHCGHLYCAQCLHSSLHVEATKGKCPMCRSKIDMKPRSGYSSKTKGYWPLELKLMTTTRKGKQKANPTT